MKYSVKINIGNGTEKRVINAKNGKAYTFYAARMTEKAIERETRVLPQEITADTVTAISCILTCRALKTTYNASGNGFIRDMFYDAVKYAAFGFNCGTIFDNRKAYTANDGADLIHDGIVFLFDYIGKTLDTVVQTDSNGRNYTIKDLFFKHIRSKIYGHEKDVKKRVYIEKVNGSVVQIPRFYRGVVDSEESYTTIYGIINKLDLTEKQKTVLQLRFDGLSMGDIAKRLNKDKSTIRDCMNGIRKKYQVIYGIIE